MVVDWGTPSEKQRMLLESDADETFYGGAAGGGKSWSLLVLACIRRLKYAGSAGIVFRKSLPELERGDGLIVRARKMLNGIAEWSERKHRFEFPNGSVLEFGYGETLADMDRYQGGEWQDICIDEATHFTKDQVDMLRSRLRTKAGGCRAILRLASNPGNVGHKWVKEEFIDPTGDPTGQTAGRWAVEVEGPKGEKAEISREFIPARLSDNKHIDKTYERQLLALPEKMRDAFLYGRWDVFEGLFFSEFSEEIHIAEREGGDWGAKVGEIMGYDYGYSAPFCCLFGSVYESGRLWVHGEEYRKGCVDTEQARIVRERARPDAICYADPSIFSVDGRSNMSTADVFLSSGINVIHADNKRIPGWARVRRLLQERAGDGRPLLLISPRCRNLIRTLKILVHDENKPEDMNTRQEDHAADALRYMTSHFISEVNVGCKKKSIDKNKIIGYLNFGARTEQSLTDLVRNAIVRR